MPKRQYLSICLVHLRQRAFDPIGHLAVAANADAYLVAISPDLARSTAD